jgi:hypothetical protein
MTESGHFSITDFLDRFGNFLGSIRVLSTESVSGDSGSSTEFFLVFTDLGLTARMIATKESIFDSSVIARLTIFKGSQTNRIGFSSRHFFLLLVKVPQRSSLCFFLFCF